MAKTRQNIRRIDTRPQNRADVAAGVTGAHLGMRGQLLGGYTPEGTPMGTRLPKHQLGGGKLGIQMKDPGKTALTDPNRAGGGGGGDPLGQAGTLATSPTDSSTDGEGVSRSGARDRENARRLSPPSQLLGASKPAEEGADGNLGPEAPPLPPAQQSAAIATAAGQAQTAVAMQEEKSAGAPRTSLHKSPRAGLSVMGLTHDQYKRGLQRGTTRRWVQEERRRQLKLKPGT